MTGQDTIEIDHKGRTLRGSGDLHVSTANLQTRGGRNQDGSAYTTSKPVAPFVKGYVVFDGPTKHSDLMDVTNAAVRCLMGDGETTRFHGAVMLRADPGRHPNGYTIHLVGQLAS